MYLILRLNVCIYLFIQLLVHIIQNVHFVWKTKGNLEDDLINLKNNQKKIT